jgi:SPP1 gp7 family putative phage head morphogenesis protein
MVMWPIAQATKAHALRRARRQDAPRPRTIARKALRAQVHHIASQMAEHAHQQVATALGVKPGDFQVDLSEHIYGFVDGVVRILDQFPVEVTRRVTRAYTEWESLGERSPRFQDYDALGTMIDTELEGTMGATQNSLRMLFGDTFGAMNEAAQVQSGVEQYVWVTARDERVRLEHAALHGGIFDWDDPPLDASQSSNGEDCHPGDDYNCRCIASPLVAGYAIVDG